MKSNIDILEKLKTCFISAFCWAIFLIIPSCEIGLGDAVDTLPPEVSISGPSTNSILRDEFVISGVCSDDTGVKTVTVELKNTELNKTYDVISVTPDKNNWQVSLNKALESGKYPYADGKYDVTVHAYDFQGKDSGPRNISIIIDNTAPLMVLTRPSSGDKYGQKFDITGQVADDSNIDLVEVYVYSKETDVLLKTIQLKNVPPTIDLSAAVFGDESYSEIYGTNKEEGDKEYYCEIKAYDAARKYPEEAGDKGNEASFFYMYDDIDDLMQNFKLTELYHIQNGLYARNASTDEALNILSIPAGQEGSIRTKRNNFVLNPLNNPYFEFSRYDEVTDFDGLIQNDIHSEKALEIKVYVGNDGILLKDETIEVYAKRVTADGTKWVYADDEEENPAVIKLYPMFDNSIAKNGSNRNININMAHDYGLVPGEAYILDVKGKDKNGNDIFNNGTEYGFYMGFSGTPPTLKITNPSTNTVYINASGKIELSGTTFHEEQKPKVFANFTKEGEEEILATIELPVSEKDKKTYEYIKEIRPSEFIAPEEAGSSETYTMSVYAEVGGNTSSPSQINIRYDVGLPYVSVSSVLPLADTSALADGKEYNVNGNISIKVAFNDDETSIKSAGYKYTDKNNQIVKEEISKTSNSTIVIDTNELKDKSDLDLLFFAEDQAGNTVEYVPVYDDSNDETVDPKYFVDQETDRPLIVIEESQIRKIDSYSSENISILSRMASVTGTISDDDGLEKYKIVLYRVDSENGAVDEESVSEIKADNLSNGGKIKVLTKQFTLQMPNENNIYKMVISATDKKDGETEVSSEWVSFVKVAGGAPAVSITSGNKGIISTKGTKNTLTFGGKFSGAHTPGTNASKHLRLFLLENTEASKNDSSTWVQIFDAENVGYGSDALTKEWCCNLSVDSLPSSVKSEGEHTVLIRVLDGNGNVSDDTLSYSVDDTKPATPETENISDYITSSSYQFKTASKDTATGSGLSGIFYQIAAWNSNKTADSVFDLTSENGWTEISGDGNISFYQTFVAVDTPVSEIAAGQLTEGPWEIYIYAADNAGNISERASKKFVANFNAPDVKITLDGSEEIETAEGNTDVTLKIVVSDKASGIDKVKTGDIVLEESETPGVYEYTVDSEGITKITVNVSNKAGLSNSASCQVTLDKTAPEITFISPVFENSFSAWQKNTKVKVSGSSDDLFGVKKVYYKFDESETMTRPVSWEGWIPASGTASWSFEKTDYVQGKTKFWVCAEDIYGNISSPVMGIIRVDTEEPVIGETKIEGMASEDVLVPNGTVYVRRNDNPEDDEAEVFKLSGTVTDSYMLKEIVLSAKTAEMTVPYEIHLIEEGENKGLLADGESRSALKNKLEKTFGLETKEWKWEIELPFNQFNDGRWKFNYLLMDESGQSAEQNTDLIIDTKAPVLHYKWNLPISADGWIKENIVTISELTAGEGISEKSKDKVSYYQTTEEKTLNNLKALEDEQWTGFSGSSRSISMEEGLNYIYIRSVDEAGNISYSNNLPGSATFIGQVDRTKPIINITKPNSGEMIGVQEDTVIEVSIEEEGSGINEAAAYIKIFDTSKNQIGDNFPLVSISHEGGSITRKATIPASTWNGRSDQEIKIEAFVEDNAGNQNDTSAKNHVLKFDRERPEIQINNPVASTVNGIIRVNGTSSDNGGMLRSVVLYRTPIAGETGTDVVISTSSEVSEKTKKLVLLQNDYATFENAEANVWEVSYDKDSVKTNGFKTNLFADDTSFTIYAVATDQSGNVHYASKTITVDQDSDRPEIKVTNFTLKSDTAWSTTEETSLWHKESKIRGTVSDDDGIEYLKVATYDFENNKWNNFSANIYREGSWETSNLPDGKLGLKFEVKDKDGKVFTSVTAPADAAALQSTPKILDGADNLLAAKGSTGTAANSILYAKIDTAAPVITDVQYSTDGTNYNSATDLNNKAFGGPDSKAYIRFTATDDNGINYAKLYLKGNNAGGESTVQTVTALNGGSGNVYTAEIETSTTPENISNLKFVIEVEDGSGAKNSESYNIRLDNEGPVLAVSYTKDLYYGSVSNQLVGTSSDAANTTVTDVFFKITEKKDALTETEISATDWECITDRTDSIHKYTSPLAWIINFTTSAQRTNGEYSASPLNDYLNKVFTPDAVDDENKASNMETVRDVTIWYYGVDQLENKGTIGHTDLTVDPSGDRPIVTVDFPTNDNDSTGGSVRLNGAAQTPSPEVGVSTIWIQIDPSYDSAFDSDWETELNTIVSGREDILGYKVESAYYYDKNGDKKTENISFKDASGETVAAKGILADMTSTSWSKYINKMDEFAAAGGNVSTMAIRVYAISPTGKVSAPLTRIFKIDPDAPQITNLQLVQYADNVNKTGARTVKSYADDMWVSGEWWLEADISDDDLGTVTYKNASGTETNLDISGKETISGKQVYKFSQKVGSSTANSYGILSYTINAQEAGGQKKSSQKVIRLNYDNKAPEFTLATALDSDANVTNKIINSNGFFTPTGTASDSGAQSGIDKIITYYTRTETSGETSILKAVDPLAEKSGTAFANTYTVTSEAGTGIPLETGKIADAVSDNVYQVKVATSLVPAFVRKGGLVRISNVYYVIKKVEASGSDTVFTLDKAVPAGFTTVDFAVAQVVEEGAVESSEADADEDGLIEKLQNNAGSYSWFASFDSNNIEDGSITAGYVVYDKAGNFTSITKSTKVINNAPRIAGFRYGTDDDGNGIVAGTELKNNLSGLTTTLNALKTGTVLYRGNDFPVQGSKASPLFKIKGVTEIYPEVVGGNGNLTYGYTAASEGADNFGTASRTVTEVSFATNSDKVTYDTIVGKTGISIGLIDFLNGDSKGSIADGVNKFIFTISDSTDGGAQSAAFSFFADVVVQDEVSPVAKIRPFFWHKKGKPDSTVTKISDYYNSLYDGDLTQGHIELENDWKLSDGYLKKADGTAKTDSELATTGLYDADPKVSGKIVLRGKASDNSLLEGLWFKIDSFTFTGVTADSTEGSQTNGYSKLATYTPGTGWTFEKGENHFKASTDASNFYIKVLNETIDQDGHTVDWELGINTAAVTGVAATDIKVYVMATDRGKLALKSGSSTETEYVPNKTAPTSTIQPQDETADENWNASGKWSPYYRMDVVPYVTGVSTSLDKLNESNPSVYNRTALGHYPVYISTEYKGNSESSLTYEDSVETVKLSGFNLEGAKYDSDALTVSNGVVSLSVDKISTSGKIALEVNDISTLNNMNNNNARGICEEDKSNFVGYYNRQPNGVNNNLLTDDLEIDVWEMNTRAASPLSGTIKEPVMKINPGNGMLGFAFVNGAMSFSMPSGTPNSGGWYTNTSHDTMNGSGDFFTSVGFNYDKLGYSYGVAAGGDINIADTIAESVCDPLAFMSSRWGKDGLKTSTCKWGNGTFNKIENIGQVNGTEAVYMKPRFMSPSIATAVHGTKTDVYLAYYDDMNAEIRFRAGTIDGTGSTYADTGVTARSDFGDFVDQYGGGVPGDDKRAPRTYNITNCNLLAGNTTGYATGYSAGEYVSVGVVSTEGNSFDDVVVVVWYDSTNMQLYYTYNVIHNNAKDGITVTKAKFTYGANGNGFETPKVIHTGSAEYCKIAVDKQGGIHVAYCDKINGDVYYSYASSYNSTFTTYLVDSYMMGGTELSLDVALDANNKPIPYISYYGNSIARPKIAYLADASKLGNSAESDKFTQKWEVSVVPTTSIVVEDHFNVGAWKNSSGKLEAPTTTYANTIYKNLKTGTGKSGYVYDGSGTKTGYPSRYFDYKNNGVLVSSGNCGQVFGNGTSNPVVGYRNKVGTKGFIETAQMK